MLARPRKRKRLPINIKLRSKVRTQPRWNRSFTRKGADPAIVGFYKMSSQEKPGKKSPNIELVELTPEDAKKSSDTMDRRRR